VTFGDDKKGKVLGTGVIKVNDCFTLNDIALVDRLRYNLLSVSQLCDADLSVIFRKSDSHVLDSSGNRVCGISRIGNVFQADFSSAQSSLRCLISQSSSELWKWHRRLSHLSFDLLCRLNGLGLLRGLPLLKFESDLVCALYHHGKMIATSHSPVNTVMTEHPEQLLHMDSIGPSRVRSMGGKWYVLVIVDDYSHYSWVFFLESKDQVFEHFRLLALRLNNEHPNCLKDIRSDNGTEFRNASFDEFCLEHGIDLQFESRSFDDILLGYTPHGRSYRVYNFETNTIVESCDVTFDEIVPCPRGVFECAGDKEIEECIFVDEGLQGVNGDVDEPLLPSTSSPELVPAFTLEAVAP
jgi:hypothetical protein